MSGLRQRGLGRGLGALITPAPAQSPAPAPAAPGSAPASAPSSIRLPADKVDVLFGGQHPPAPVAPAAPGTTAADGTIVGELRMLAPSAIVPNPRQPRREFDEVALEELAASIREVGVLQPVVVRRAGDGYELVMGERRWRAAQLAEVDELPAVVRDTADDDMLRDALLENLHRSQLNPLEEAAAYEQLLDDFGCTHDELAARLGRSRSHVSNTLRLLNLPPALQRRVAAGVLSAGHARALLVLDDADQQEALAGRIVAEGLSVRSVEELVAMGQPAGRASAPRTPRPNSPELDEVAMRLTDSLETRVRIEMGRRKGRITVEFAGPDDLARIVAAISGAQN